MSPAPLTIHLFGPLQVRVDGQPLPRPRTRSVEWLLALLVLRHDRAVERSWLAGTLWPESEERQARENLRHDLVELRRALGAESGRIQSPTRDTLLLDLTGADVDVLDFDAAIQSEDEEALRRAVARYTGPLLDGCVEEWALVEREKRAEQHRAALARLAERERASGRAGERESERAEGAGESGRDASPELPASPTASSDSPARPLSRSPALSSAGLPRPLTSLIGRESELREVLGLLRENRLVTLTGGGGVGKTRLALEVAALASSDLAGAVFWVDLTALADGALILQSVAAALGLREHAAEAAEELTARLSARLSEGTTLLALDNCEHVSDTAAQAVQMLLARCASLRVLATSRQRLDLTGEVAWRVPSLAVPDDGEGAQVEGPAVQLFVERAAAARPGFRLGGLADALAVAQVCRRLDGIPLAIELAAARASVLSLKQIADRLDDRFRLLTGGSRTALPRHQTLRALIDWSYDHLSEEERVLLCRLSVFAGGWTLEAAEAVCSDGVGSWQLAVGSGTDRTVGLPTANCQLPTDAVLDLLDSLVDRSLVLSEEHGSGLRYRMLETVREYAREKLGESGGEADTRHQHLAWALQLAEEARPDLYGPTQETALAQLEAELDNLRAALEWARLSEERREEHMRLVSALWPFWLLHGYLSEGREHLRLALRDAHDVPLRMRAQVLLGAAMLANEQWDLPPARAAAEECLALYRDLDDAQGVADALLCLGTAARLAHDAAARSYLEESLEICRRIGHGQGLVAAVGQLGRDLMLTGQLAAAKPLLEESLTTARALGDENAIAQSLYNLGALARYERDLSRALDLLEQSREIFQRLGRLQGVATALEEIALVHEARGELEQALARHQDCMANWHRLGNRAKAAWELCMMGNVAYRQGDYEAARVRFTEGLQLAREAPSAPGEAFAYNSLGMVAHQQGEQDRARELHRQALAIYRGLNHLEGIAWSLERLGVVEARCGDPYIAARLLGAESVVRAASGAKAPNLERIFAALQEKLGPEAWEAAWQEGRALSREQAIAFALDDAGA